MKKKFIVSTVLGLSVFLFSQQTLSYRKAHSSQVANNPVFESVDKLYEEQKYQAAHDKTFEIYQTSKKKKDEQLATESLIRLVQFKVGLHKMEEAVQLLREEPRPAKPELKVLLEMYYAVVLMSYYERYSWEIQQREKTTGSEKDLKTWTKEDISNAILKSFNLAMEYESILSAPPPDFYRYYVLKNTFPKDVRPTLKDIVVYSAVEHLSNSSYWSPKDANAVYTLSHPQLVKGAIKANLLDTQHHPLSRMSYLLTTHKTFHASKNRLGAALEAEYVLIENMFQHVSGANDKKVYSEALLTLQKNSANKKHEWWAKGQALLAQQQIANTEDIERNIKALRFIDEAIKLYPDSFGGKQCASIRHQILTKNFSMIALNHDGENRKTIQIKYKNINKLYFRAYSFDFKKALDTVIAGEVWHRPWADEYLANTWGAPVAQWTSDIPSTPDHSEHTAYIQPPLKKRGGYVIVASLDSSFANNSENQVEGIPFIFTDIVLQRWALDSGQIELRAVSGETGLPLSGVEVSNWSRSKNDPWQRPAQKHAQEMTGADGFVRFRSEPDVSEYFQLAQKGESYAFIGKQWVSRASNEDKEWHRVLVFTDRRIFRPGQTILWKVLDFKGQGKSTQFKVTSKQKLVVELQDANRKVVAVKTVTTNEYGTASGEFIAAKDKALGSWQIIVKRGNDKYAGYSHVSVEEYKRPTFEVAIKDSLQPLRLNKKASIGGEARYYFGQPVSSGKIKWSVVRTPIWSHWWYGYRNSVNTETVATGTSKLAANGTFEIEFIPKADEREAKNKTNMRYQFTLNADVTDDGGETRQGTKTVQLGFVSLDAQIQIDNGFYLENKSIIFPVTLSDLNGLGKKGTGQWTVYKLKQPERTPLPVEIPLSDIEKNKFTTEHDVQRPRWDTSFDPQLVMHSWGEGQEMTKGKVDHDSKGRGEVKISTGLSVGAYVLVYKNKDEFGADLTIKRNFVVAGMKNNLSLPLFVVSEKPTYAVGDTARILIVSGLKDQPLLVETYTQRRRLKKYDIKSGQLLEIPITEKERGGFSILVSGVRDYQLLRSEIAINVPWSNKQLKVEMATFRDKIRPGSKETIKITVKDAKGKFLEPSNAELLAFMYDRSLDFFGAHSVDSPLTSYPTYFGVAPTDINVGAIHSTHYIHTYHSPPHVPYPIGDYLVMPDSYGIGGPGSRQALARGESDSYSVGSSEDALMEAEGAPMAMSASRAASPREEPSDKNTKVSGMVVKEKQQSSTSTKKESSDIQANMDAPLRSDFSETAFWKPHLLLDKDGSVTFEFQVPDSLTSWNFWATAITKDIRAGTFNGQTQSIKDMMVRPYLPRFLREGDDAEVKVMVNNSSDKEMSGKVQLVVEHPETGKSAASDFGLSEKDLVQNFTASKDGSTTVTYKLKAPKSVGSYSVSVKATTKNLSDGEKRLLPVLPSRMHLAQSRFVTLRNKDQKTLEFKDLAKNDDASLINDRLVLTIDAQLFYGVLKSVPYLITYPYECAEQTLNRFLSTGIITEVFKKYPSVQKMAKEFSKRETPLEKFDGPDANQRMLLEESPWLQQASGGEKSDTAEMAKVLDSRIVLAERDRALSKLKKMQNSDGGFPWFDGGRPDEYITLYLLMGFARAQEFNVPIPKDMVVKAWKFLKSWSERDLKKCMDIKGCHEMVTMINYALTSYKDASWTGGVFLENDKTTFLNYSFAAWKQHSPLLKGYLALTLKRMGRAKDAELVWASVMDSAKSTDDLGTYWAPEERSWLWYNDTIETHAFALRVQMEMAPTDKKNDGLVQWLFLNKKLNHWKSTRATAESIYSLVHYLEKEKSLGVREEISAQFAGQDKKFVFEPDKYSGGKNQMVVTGDKIQPGRDSKVTVSKSTPGFAFASATWHFSTEKIPTKGDGDMFEVSRKYFLREKKGTEWTLKPVASGTVVKVGDQVEVQISLRAKHAAEYVHLRDPRGAGFEPEESISGYKYDLGLAYYQEVRDSGGNFFFNRLPVGQYTFKYRIRANMAGTFKVGPATVQSLYAPEFNAYSQGESLKVAL